MKLLLSSLLVISPLLTAAASGGRSVYLNGVDISAAKNQALSQADIKIDSKGDIYISAPQYEVQQESTFVPLGRQQIGQSSAIEHKKAGALHRKAQAPSAAEPAEELVSPSETGDTLSQPEASEPPSEARAQMNAKEGTRTVPDANARNPGEPGAALPGATPANP